MRRIKREYTNEQRYKVFTEIPKTMLQIVI